jgi:hypothetical protein
MPPQHEHLTRNLDFQDARKVRASASTRVGTRSFVFGQMKVSDGSAKAISRQEGPLGSRHAAFSKPFPVHIQPGKIGAY